MTGVPPNKRDVNMVFQSYRLFPHMTVQHSVPFGLRRKGRAARRNLPQGRRDARTSGSSCRCTTRALTVPGCRASPGNSCPIGFEEFP